AGVPGPPANVQTSVVGSVLNVSWSAPTTGGAPTGYTLVARTTLGALIASQPVGTITTFAATVPDGTYVISVYATNAAGAGAESAPSTAVVPSGSVVPPGAPRNLSATQSGSAVVFAWTPPASGGPVATYVLSAATTPGGAPIASLSVGGALTQTSVPGVPPGVYYARVVAVNAAGTSLPSNTATVTVAAAGGSRSTLNPAGVPTFIQALASMRIANGQSVRTFDDFTFPAGSTFRQVAWQGIYCVEDNSASAPSPTASAFVVSVYPDQGGRPNLNASLGSVTVPVAQVNQTFNGVFVGASCGAASSTRWSLYSYATTLPASFTAQPGVRYWLSVEAITPSFAVVWGWRSGTVDNRVALQLSGSTFTTLTLDRAFALAP
ncbi:MAG: fibronectin type III domain-containing protein, partial [Vicinamibacterales bacterium]